MDETPAGSPKSAALIERVKNILLKPAAEWARIEGEAATIGGLYRSYVLPVAAIPPVAALIGSLVFGQSAFGVTYRPSIGAALSTAVVQYVLTLVGVFVFAALIDFLAPRFDGTANRIQAFKVAAYSATAAWVAGIFALVPSLGGLGILGLYSLYLLYLGLPRLMKAPADKAMSYTVVVVVAGLAVAILIGMIAAPLALMMSGPPTITADGKPLSAPGFDMLDLGLLKSAVC